MTGVVSGNKAAVGEAFARTDPGPTAVFESNSERSTAQSATSEQAVPTEPRQQVTLFVGQNIHLTMENCVLALTPPHAGADASN